MRELTRRAPTGELYELMDMIIDSEFVTDAQAKLLYTIVDELTERGEMEKSSEEDIRAQFEATNEKNDSLQSMFNHTVLHEHDASQWRDRLWNDLQKDHTHSITRRKRVRAILFSAVASIVLLFLVNTAALAAGYDFFGSVAKWAKNAVYFVFGDTDDEIAHDEYDPLRMTLSEQNIHVALPTYIPKGFRFDTIEPDEPDEFSSIVAWFANGDAVFSVRVKPIDITSSFSEINDGEQETYKGRYLITANMNRTKALWYDGLYELQVQGNLTYAELTQLLDSI